MHWHTHTNNNNNSMKYLNFGNLQIKQKVLKLDDRYTNDKDIL